MRPSILPLLLALLLPATAVAGLLEDYVQRPDPAFHWELRHEQRGLLARHFQFHLVSQQWLDETLVDRPLWTHEVRMSLPRLCSLNRKRQRTAILLVSGGKNPRTPDAAARPLPPEAALIARAFCRPVIEVRQVPNQPLYFSGDGKRRREDALLAYSLDRYLRHEPGDWPAHAAMVKAVVRAMDAMQAFSRERRDIPDLEGFVLIGTSKRGWTSWLTAAVDPRVRAIVPVSIDMLNLADQFPRHFAAYGDYAPALRDYREFDIGCRTDSARGQELLAVIDPYHYRERLTLPKLLINSAGDEFFLSDSSQHYFHALPGRKNRLRYTVNSDHRQQGIDRLDLLLQARNWVDDVLAGRRTPTLDWERDAQGQLVIRSNLPARTVRLWQAHNPSARDFRLETLGAVWTAQDITPDADGHYRVRLTAPAQGWQAVLVEAVYGGRQASRQQVVTTDVFVTPDTLPHAQTACHAEPGSRPEALSQRKSAAP